MKCDHKHLRCLNHYDYFRKYLCNECGKVLMCECEKELSITFLPHQTTDALESGTRKRYKVSGFEPNLCAECRGVKEEPHPRAAIWGQKGKVERFYWREIFKTYCEEALKWGTKTGINFRSIMDFEAHHAEKSKELKREAKKHWQDIHKRSPKYDILERTEASFLSKIKIPINEIKAKYIKEEKDGQNIGKWIDQSGQHSSAEEISKQHYEALGYDVRKCERKLISMLVGTFLYTVIQGPDDPRNRIVFRGSTRGWTPKNRNTPNINFLLPEDFGSNEYYKRREKAFNDWFEVLDNTDLLGDFEMLLEPSTTLRDYLWVNDDSAVELARWALRIIPQEHIMNFLKWSIQDFWSRQPGWPDFLAYKNVEYLFIEVKSPLDELSLEQMNWFEFAIETNIPCEICRIKKARE